MASTDIELDEIRPLNEEDRSIQMPKDPQTARASQDSAKSPASVTVRAAMPDQETIDERRAGDGPRIVSTKHDRRDFTLGIALLLIVVLLWTSSNFITQDLFEEGFDRPFLVTYLNTASFTLYLIPSAFRYWRRRDETNEYLPVAHGPELDDEDPPTAHLDATSTAVEPRIQSDEDLPPLTTRETASLAATFCFLWFIANWSVNASFQYTSVGSSTVLASCSGLFTMAVGRLLGIERLTSWKIGAVVTSFAGVLLVSYADAGRPPVKAPPPSSATGPSSLLPPPSNPLLGDALALLSALFYALYLTLLKVRIKSESRVDMQLLFGFVGLFNIIGCWPLGVVLHLTGAERFGLPVGWKEWSGVAINMAVTFSSDFIYVIAMLKTTPLVVTLGLTLTIPLAIVGDYVLQSRGVTLFGLCGAVLVVAAFGVIGWGDSKAKERQTMEPVVVVNEDV